VPAPHHWIFTDWMLFLTPNQQCQGTEGKNKVKEYDKQIFNQTKIFNRSKILMVNH